MMGHRESTKSGIEYDVVSAWKHRLCIFQKSKVSHGVKKQMSRRARREAKRTVRA